MSTLTEPPPRASDTATAVTTPTDAAPAHTAPTDAVPAHTAPADAARAEADATFRELLTPAGREDPYPHYARLRELSPVHPSRLGPLVLTRYEDCEAVLRSPAFRVHDAQWLDGMVPHWRERPALAQGGMSMVFCNPPDHTRLRGLVAGAFTARRVAGLAPMVEHHVEEILDEMADAGADGSAVDLHDLFALPIPVAVIAALLGVPEQDWLWLRGLAPDLASLVDFFAGGEDFDAADRAAELFVPYFHELAARRRAEPRDDLITGLVAAADGSDALTGDEIVQTVLLLFVAGFETAVNLLTNGTLALLEHPQQLALFRAEPSLAAQVVEESLRYDAPVQGASRVAGADAVVAGRPVRKGKEVWTLLGAANRDPDQFADPDRFDITRTGVRPATFGAGAHFCLGAPLARLEARIAFTALVRRFPKLATAGPRERRVNFNLRGFNAFPVTVR